MVTISNTTKTTISLMARHDGAADRVSIAPGKSVELDDDRAARLLDWKGHGRKLVAAGHLELGGLGVPEKKPDRRELLIRELLADGEARMRALTLEQLERAANELRAGGATSRSQTGRSQRKTEPKTGGTGAEPKTEDEKKTGGTGAEPKTGEPKTEGEKDADKS